MGGLTLKRVVSSRLRHPSHAANQGGFCWPRGHAGGWFRFRAARAGIAEDVGFGW